MKEKKFLVINPRYPGAAYAMEVNAQFEAAKRWMEGRGHYPEPKFMVTYERPMTPRFEKK